MHCQLYSYLCYQLFHFIILYIAVKIRLYNYLCLFKINQRSQKVSPQFMNVYGKFIRFHKMAHEETHAYQATSQKLSGISTILIFLLTLIIILLILLHKFFEVVLPCITLSYLTVKYVTGNSTSDISKIIKDNYSKINYFGILGNLSENTNVYFIKL